MATKQEWNKATYNSYMDQLDTLCRRWYGARLRELSIDLFRAAVDDFEMGGMAESFFCDVVVTQIEISAA